MKTITLNGLLVTAALTLSLIPPAGTSHALAQDIVPAGMDELTPITKATPTAPAAPTAPTAPAVPAAIDADPAIWVVKDEDTTIYLFGTVHILKPGITWFDEAVKTAFDTSDELVVELVEPPEAEMGALFGKLAVDPKGKTLRSKLNAADLVKYEAAMKKADLKLADLDPLEPWAVAVALQMTLLIKDGFDVKSGVESILTAQAKKTGKPVTGLETAEFQLGVFDTLPQKKQIRFLIDASTDLDKGKAQMDSLIDNWAMGKPEQLAKLMNEGMEDPVLYKKLLTNRNANWAAWIKQRMTKPGTVFMAVGAGHLSGPTSVPVLIKKKGLEAARIPY
jgi:uncharacterized protein